MDTVKFLFENRDEKYRDFLAPLCPSVDPERIIGVRTPILRTHARAMIKSGEAYEFLNRLPHEYFEEDQLHAFIISELKDYKRVISELEKFLPYINNWATCDQLIPKAFKRDRGDLPEKIALWLKSEDTYTVRFAIACLMRYYLDGEFDPEYPAMVSAVDSDEYWVNMMSAWCFATALAKRYDDILPFITERRLTPWVHNKTIGKASDSYRITEEQKQFLKKFRIK